MNKERIIAIMERAKAKQATATELQELADALDRETDDSVTPLMEKWLEQHRIAVPLPGKERVNSMLADILEAGKLLDDQGKQEELDATEAPGTADTIEETKTPGPAVIPLRKRYGKLVAAAIVVLLAGMAFLLWQQRPTTQSLVKIAPPPITPIGQPAGRQAVLTLADGTTVTLDEQRTDTITQQGNTNIVKEEEGRLAYRAGKTAAAGLALRNKVSTPRGGQYRVDLADGSRVWLNAASSLVFPVDFNGNERVVELEGEAYFEVAHKDDQPFIVKASQTTVQVLGTHFNVSAYGDETFQKTTLLEGKVQVMAGDGRYQLQPGQQVIFDKKNTKARLVQHASLEEAVAWKNGYFQFSGADGAALLREIGRWYNIEVVFNGMPTGYELNGKIDRSIRLSSIVTALQEGGVHCTLEDNKLIVNK